MEHINNKVLVVEDAPFMRALISDTLVNELGCTVIEAADGDEAVEKFLATKPKLTIMNVTMPKSDGIKATKKICDIDSAAQIIMLSAKSFPALILDSIKAGAQDFIVKPFDADYLLNTVIANMKTKVHFNMDTVKSIRADRKVCSDDYYEKEPLTQESITKLINICRGSYKIDDLNFLIQ